MSHRILVIDHNPTGLQRVVEPLRDAGYEVAVAQTAADGASAFGRFEPALVFIAARLPRTHGTVLCRELKRTDAGASTPIVLLVESTGIQIDLPPLDQFGADRLLQRPVAADELLATCSDLLGDETEDVAGSEVDGASLPAFPEEPDDGLSTALEELDSLDFDLPGNANRPSPDAPLPTPASVPIGDESGKDIEDRIDDLFTGGAEPAPAPAPAPEPTAAPTSDISDVSEPVTGRDNDADAAVLDELNLEGELNARLASGTSPIEPEPTQQEPAPAPAATQPQGATPPAASATAIVPPSTATAGRFQTESLTSRPSPSPQTRVAEGKSGPRLPRWSWVAIPVIVGLVALAALFLSRARHEEPAAASTPPVSRSNDAGTPDASSAGIDAGAPIDVFGGDLRIATEEPVDEAPPVAEKPAPRPEPIVTRVVEPEPEPEPEPVKPAPAKKPEPQVEERPAPIVEPEPEPEPVVDKPEPQKAVAAEPVVEPQEEEPPAPIVEPEPEPQPEPVTRDPILVRRVEPRVSEKDVRKNGGTVVLRVRVNETGAVTRVLVDQGIPGSPLEAAAVAAVLRWRYEPALDRDEPVEAWTTATFTFGK